ncbi:MAG: sigma-70 family RNA polymerase sigma factor [Peptoniphilus sp.]|nr:sigma-70 family RNA polymerase sigma factor [Peptoniphilus sp.]
MDRNKSFQNLINDREDKLYRIAFSYVRNKEDALDCLQSALLKGLDSFDTLRDYNYFDTWFIRILINTCLDHIKDRSVDLPLEESLNASDVQRDFEGVTDLLRSIEGLQKEEQEIIFLKYFMGYKNEEISETMHIKTGTVKSRLNRVIRKLRAKLS